jgi:hypothetical protein
MWTMLVFFLWVVWIIILISVFVDIFKRHDIGGWGKVGWIILVVILPFLGVFIYLIANSKSMADRRMNEAAQAQSQMDDYIRTVSSSGSATAEIARAKELLDSGAITQAEFDAIKAKSLG